MARRNNRKSDDLFFALTMLLPWWVPFLLAGGAYAVLARYSVLVALEWACIFVFIGLVLPFVKWKRNELLASVTDIKAIRDMDWRDFELMVGEAFRRQGYIVVERGGAAADGGIDLVLHKRSEKVIVQCKQWKTQRVGVSPVRELRGVVAREKATRGIFVISGSFTHEALAESQGQPLELIDGPKLLKLVQDVQTKNTEPQQEKSHPPEVVSAAVPTTKMEVVSEKNEPSCPRCGGPMLKKLASRGGNAGNEFWSCRAFPKCRGSRSL